jgi:alcohol dehydrogenase (cytochrome c)
MRKRAWFRLVGWVLLAAVIGVMTLPSIRWRLHLMALEATGQIPDVSWREMRQLMSSGSMLDHGNLIASKDPYGSIKAPAATPARVGAGHEVFGQQCAVCHGDDARGRVGPDLTKGDFRHGASDWALYRTITRGIPGTPMLGHDLPFETAWQLVSFLRDTVAKNAIGSNGAGKGIASAAAIPELNATFARLKTASDNPADWLTYSGSYNGQRHSRLSQITRANVGRLRLRWLFQFPKFSDGTECTPVVVGQTMFVTLPPGDVWALDTRTGERLWSYSYVPTTPVKHTPVHNRGVAVLGNTVFLGTLNAHLIALNAQTGKLLWDVNVGDNRGDYGITSAPLALGDRILIGVSGGDFGIRGFVDAYSPTDGKRLWRFYTVPGPGDPGHETWGDGDAWKRGGGATWLTGSYDSDLDLIYWGVGNPGPDFQGDVRPGINLYTCSVIALEAATGRLRWHFQFTPHDEHDWDSTQVPVLADALFQGQRRKLMYFANRNGFFYILDRTTGKFLHAEAFAKQTWASGFDSAGAPIQTPEGHPTVEGAVVFPNSQGATNWWSPSYDAASNTFYVPAMEGSDVYKKGVVNPDDNGGYLASRATFGPTWTAVRALDATTGRLRWEYRFPPRQPSIVMGGLLSTDGGLVFGGDDSLLVALESRQGKELWRFNTGTKVMAAPITYLVDGRQNVTLVAGMTVLTFALDGK